MNTSDLIEAMARSYGKHVDHETGKPCATCQRIARAMAPAVVAFVAAWLELQGNPGYLSEIWREEMGA